MLVKHRLISVKHRLIFSWGAFGAEEKLRFSNFRSFSPFSVKWHFKDSFFSLSKLWSWVIVHLKRETVSLLGVTVWCTGCFMGAHFLAVEFDNAVLFSSVSGLFKFIMVPVVEFRVTWPVQSFVYICQY